MEPRAVTAGLGFTLRDDLDAATLASLWQELEARVRPPAFLGWCWIGSWLAEAGIRPVVLMGHAEGRLVLLGVLAPWDRRGRLPIVVPGLALHTTGDEARDVITIEYNGFLTDPAWAGRGDAAAIEFLVSGVTAAGRRREELHLRNVIAGWPGAPPPAGVVARELFRKPSWHVDLAALRASGTPYLDSLSANTRQQLRRALRQYRARGALEARRAGDVAEAMAWLAELKRLHQAYWTGKGEPGAFAYPFFERFERRLIENGLAAGAVELVRVSCGGEAIGYLQNLCGNGRVLSYQSGIDYRDAKLKPGLVCHVLCIELHLAEGAAVYDFMAGAARYKASLGRPGPELVYRVLERPTAALRLERGLRALVQRWRR